MSKQQCAQPCLRSGRVGDILRLARPVTAIDRLARQDADNLWLQSIIHTTRTSRSYSSTAHSDTTRNYRYSSSLRETCSLILNQKRPVIIVGSIKIGQTVPANFNTSKQLCWQEAETQGRNYNQGVLWVSSKHINLKSVYFKMLGVESFTAANNTEIIIVINFKIQYEFRLLDKTMCGRGEEERECERKRERRKTE